MTNKGHKNSHPSPSEDTNQTIPGSLSFPGVRLQEIRNVWESAFWDRFVNFTTNTQKPEGGYSYCQQEAFCSPGVFHTSSMPLPSTTLNGSEALLDPCSHSIPADVTGFWRHVSEDKPCFFHTLFPTCQESGWDSPGLEGNASTLPAFSWLLSETGYGTEYTFTFRTECATSVDAHEGMPSQLDDMSEQFWGIQSTICHDDDSITLRNTGFERSEHTEPFPVPCSFGVAFEHSPCYRYGTTTVDYIYTQHSESVRKGSGIQSDSLPPTYYPAQQEGEAALHIQVNSLVTPFVFTIVAPFAQSLTHGVLFDIKQECQKKLDCS